VAWQTANAQCIGTNCNSELQTAAQIYATNCMNGGDPLGISEAEFISIGQAAASSPKATSASEAAASTSTTRASTTTTTSSGK
jgi:hypothetical protein